MSGQRKKTGERRVCANCDNLPAQLWRHLFEAVVTEIEVLQISDAHQELKRQAFELVVAQVEDWEGGDKEEK